MNAVATGEPRTGHAGERRSALRAALEGGFQAYVVVDPVVDRAAGLIDLELVYANPSACSSLGQSEEHLRGLTVRAIWPGAAEQLCDAGAGVLATGTPIRVELHASALGPLAGAEVRLFRLGQRLGLLWQGSGNASPEAAPAGVAGYRQAWDEMSVGMLLGDSRGLIVRCNRAAEALLGVDRREVVGEAGWPAIREDGSPFPIQDGPVAVSACTGSPVRNVVMGIPGADGDLTWVLVNATPVLVGDRTSVQSVIVSLRDITEFRDSQAALRAADARFAGVIDALGDPVYVLEPLRDDHGAVVDFVVSQFNPAGASPGRSRTGAGQPQAGSKLSTFYPGSASDGFAQACRAALDTGTPQRLVVSWPWPGAAVRDFDVTIVRFAGAGGLALAVVGRDVTSTLADKARLAASHLRFRRSLDALPDPVFLLAPVRDEAGAVVDLRYTHLNTAAEELYARPAHEVIGRHLLDMFPSSVEIGSFACFVEPLRTGRQCHMRIPAFAEGGVEGAFDVSASLCGDEVVVAVRDITSQLAADAALARSQERFQTLAENATDVVLLIGPDARIQWVSGTGALGWSAAEMLGRDVIDFLNREDLTPERFAAARELLAGRTVAPPQDGYLFRMRTKSGGYHWVASTPKPVTDAEGAPVGIVAGLRDVDALVRSRQDAQLARDKFDATLEALVDPHVMLKPIHDDRGQIVDFVYTQVNAAACAYNHRSRDQMLGQGLLDLLPAHSQTGLLAQYAHAFQTGQPLILDDVPYHQEMLGQTRRYNVRAVRVGEELSYTWTDVTAAHEAAAALAESEERYRLLAENASDLVLRTDGAGCVDWISPSAQAVLGRPAEQIVGREMSLLLHRDDRSALAGAVAALGSGDPVSLRARVLRADGSHLWMGMSGRSTAVGDGASVHHVFGLRDIDEQVRMEGELRRRAQYDELTGLLKRDGALTRLAGLTDEHRKRGTACAVLFVDVDAFKQVNDSRGHGVGDQVLRALATRLRASLRATDTIARMGGDEFLCILDGVHDLAEARAIADQVRHNVQHPIELDSEPPAAISVSIGVTLLRPGDSVDDLVNRADTAMYQAKREGRNRIEVLDIG